MLLVDETKVCANRVFDRTTKELDGFAELLRFYNKLCYFWETKWTSISCSCISHKRTSNKLNISIFLFCYQEFNFSSPIFWQGVSALEKSCTLWMIATTSDGTSTNRRFYWIHMDLDCNSQSVIEYNLYTRKRFINFVSDTCLHCKTGRNCFYHSENGKQTWYMWNDRKHPL